MKMSRGKIEKISLLSNQKEAAAADDNLQISEAKTQSFGIPTKKVGIREIWLLSRQRRRHDVSIGGGGGQIRVAKS